MALPGDRRGGIGARNVVIIASILAAWVFASTAWQQFAPLSTAGRIVFSLVFAVWGGGAVWLVYGLARLGVWGYRRLRGRPGGKRTPLQD